MHLYKYKVGNPSSITHVVQSHSFHTENKQLSKVDTFGIKLQNMNPLA